MSSQDTTGAIFFKNRASTKEVRATKHQIKQITESPRSVIRLWNGTALNMMSSRLNTTSGDWFISCAGVGMALEPIPEAEKAGGTEIRWGKKSAYRRNQL